MFFRWMIDRFQTLERIEQEQGIIRICQIITVGTGLLGLSIFQTFLPDAVRVVSLPVVLIACWWAGTCIVGPQIITRFNRYLN